MFDVQRYYLERPRKLVSLGRVLIAVAFSIVFSGLFAQLLLVAPTTLMRIANPRALAPVLEQAYPDLWWLTWLVPETLIGALPALALAGVGFWCVSTGRAYQRALR